MRSYENWSPYVGSGSVIVAVVLFLIMGVLLFVAFQFRVAYSSLDARTGL